MSGRSSLRNDGPNVRLSRDEFGLVSTLDDDWVGGVRPATPVVGSATAELSSRPQPVLVLRRQKLREGTRFRDIHEAFTGLAASLVTLDQIERFGSALRGIICDEPRIGPHTTWTRFRPLILALYKAASARSIAATTCAPSSVISTPRLTVTAIE